MIRKKTKKFQRLKSEQLKKIKNKELMLNHDSLGDRLNAVKYGEPIPKAPPQAQPVFAPQVTQHPQVHQMPSIQQQLYIKIISIIDTFIASLLYGYGVMTVFGLHWSFFGSLSVGFLINHMVSVFPSRLFPKLFK